MRAGRSRLSYQCFKGLQGLRVSVLSLLWCMLVLMNMAPPHLPRASLMRIMPRSGLCEFPLQQDLPMAWLEMGSSALCCSMLQPWNVIRVRLAEFAHRHLATGPALVGSQHLELMAVLTMPPPAAISLDTRFGKPLMLSDAPNCGHRARKSKPQPRPGTQHPFISLIMICCRSWHIWRC